MVKIPEILVGIQMEGQFRFLPTGILGMLEYSDQNSPFHF